MTQSESPGNCPDLHSSPLFGCSGLSLSERKTVRKLKWVFLFGAIAIVLLWTHESVMAQAESPKPTNQQGTTNLVPPPSASAPPTSTTNTPQSPNSPQTFTPSVVEQKDEPGIHKKKQDENSNQEKSVFQEEREDQQNESNITEIVVQVGHLKQVNAVAFAPDKRFILSGSRDATIKLWDAVRGKELRSFQDNKEEINSLSVSRDGRFVLSGDAGHSRNVRLWEISTGKTVRSFDGFTTHVNSVAISPDGQLAIACSEQLIKVWNLETGSEIYTLSGHTGTVRALAISGNSKFLISGGDDKLLKIWDLVTGKNIRTFVGHTEGIASLALSPDGKFVISVSANDQSRMWELATGSQSKVFDCNGAITLAISPDGKNVAFGGVETIQIWDIVKGKKIKEIKGHKEGWIRTIAYSVDGTDLLSGGDDKCLKLWNAISGKEIWASGGQATLASSLAISTFGDKLAVGNESGILNVWDLISGQQIKTIKHTMGVQSVAIDPNGTKILAGGWDYKEHATSCKLWDTGTGNLISSCKTEGDYWVQATALTTDDKSILWSANTDLYQSDILTGQKIRTFGKLHQFEVKHLETHGTYALSCDDNMTLVWNIETGEILEKFDGLRGTLSKDGNVVLLLGMNEDNGKLKVMVWDIATNREVRRNTGPDQNSSAKTMAFFINSASLSPDKKLALWSTNNELHLWDIEKGKERFTFKGHTNKINDSGFFANGRYAYSGSQDASIRLWNLETGKEMARLYNFADGEWVILTSESYFNSSPSGINYLCVRQGDSVFDFGSVQAAFQNQAIVQSTLQGKETLIDQKLGEILTQYNPGYEQGNQHFGLGLVEIILFFVVLFGAIIFFFMRRR